MAKYGNDVFQKAMTEYYSQPTAHKDNTAGKIPNTVNVAPKGTAQTAKAARAGSAASEAMSATSKVSKIGKALPRVGMALMFIDAGIQMWQLADSLSRINSFYPKNFTLFDWQDIINVIDDMEAFLVHDERCFEFTVLQGYNIQQNLTNCFAYSVDTAAASNRAAQLFEPTTCWADSVQSLGHSNLFACTSGSTCCTDEYCTTKDLCYNCPTPVLEGTNKFGCDALQQRCMCGTVPKTFTQCASNLECGLKSQCVLLSSLDSISYGTIPCSKCPTHNVVCLIPSTGFPAQCACLMEQTVAYDMCKDTSGQVTVTNPNKLCAYTPRATGSTSTWAWDFQELMVVPCIRAYTAVCSTVYRAGNPTMMPVAISIRAGQASRRLLASEDHAPALQHAYQAEYELVETEMLHDLIMHSDWSHVAAPCDALARAYRGNASLGILEKHALRQCAFWRHVGRRVLRQANLTQDQDTFLLSVDDFAAALAQKDVLLMFLRNPQIFTRALMYHPWLKPLRAVASVLSNVAEQLHWMDAFSDDVVDFVMGEIELNVQDRLVEKDDEPVVPSRAFRANATQVSKSSRPVPNITQVLRNQPHWEARRNRRYNQSQRASPTQNKTTGRKLLQTSISAARQELLKVQAYSANVATGQAPNQVTVQRSWLRGSGTWPPSYDFSLQSCPIAVVTLEITLDTIGMLTTYYDHFDAPQRPVDRSFRQALPSVTWAYNRTAYQAKTWSSWIFHTAFHLAGVDPAQAIQFFLAPQTSQWSLRWILGTAIHCDLPSVLSCSNHTRDLFMSTIVFLLLYLLVAFLANSMGFPVLSVVFFLSYPMFILWYAYGMAPTCFPLVPTCLLQDFIVAGNALLPTQIWLPKRLLCHPEQYNQTFNQTCLRPCEELNFTAWTDPIAFALCNVDAPFCLSLTNLTTGSTQADNILAPFLAPLRDAILEKHAIVALAQDLDAYRTCAWVTGIVSLPFFAALLVLFMFATSALVALLQILPVLVSLLAQSAAYHGMEHA